MFLYTMGIGVQNRGSKREGACKEQIIKVGNAKHEIDIKAKCLKHEEGTHLYPTSPALSEKPAMSEYPGT